LRASPDPGPVLVTGGTGFVGGHLRAHLAAEAPGTRVVTAGLGAEADIPLDICDSAAIASALATVQPRAVVHLAAIAAPAEAKGAPEKAWAVNFRATLDFATALFAAQPEAKFIFAGSAEAYGASFLDCPDGVPETAPLNPMTTYAATKAAADIALGQMAHEGRNIIRFRPFNHTGAGQPDDYVVPAFARQIADVMAGRREPVISVGNLEAERDFSDVRDIVGAYAAALHPDVKGGPRAVYNLSSGRPVPIRAILDKLIALSGREIAVEVDPDRLRPSEITRASGLNAAAKADLGWAPAIPLDQTIADVLTYWRANAE